MALGDIIGQDRALRILLGSLKRNRIPSAMLFSGDCGIGKKLTAINYAKAINCIQPRALDCCGECMACRKIDAATHPDVMTITLDNMEDMLSLKEKTGKDKNRYEYPIEAVHRIEEFLHMRPYEGRKKIVIIDDADAMNINTANAFLKTLEEPPDNSMIILVSSNPTGLLDTIRSRCMNIKFYPLAAERCKEVISKNSGTKNISIALNIAMGRPGLALSMDFMKEKEIFIKFLNDMLKGEKDSWADRSVVKSWLDMAGIFLRDMAIKSELGIKSTELLAFSEMKTQDQRLKTILDAYLELEKIKGLLDFNLNKSITWNYASSMMRMLMARSS